jgi:hypothetical protein
MVVHGNGDDNRCAWEKIDERIQFQVSCRERLLIYFVFMVNEPSQSSGGGVVLYSSHLRSMVLLGPSSGVSSNAALKKLPAFSQS